MPGGCLGCSTAGCAQDLSSPEPEAVPKDYFSPMDSGDLPHQRDLLHPMIEALRELGGFARVREIFESVVSREGFSAEQIADLSAELISISYGTNCWTRTPSSAAAFFTLKWLTSEVIMRRSL